MIKIHNPIYFLIDNYYYIKFVEKRKSLIHKSINFFISNTYKRSNLNKKFKNLRPIFNAMTSLFLGRNVVHMTKAEMEKMLDEIDKGFEITPRRYHLENYYKEFPMTPPDFQSLMKFNFYDMLVFKYISHKDKEKVFKQMEQRDIELRKCDFF